MGIKIGAINADTTVKLGSTTIQAGYIGFNQFYNTYTSILDTYPSAYHAQSLRKLKSTYTGFCLRVRRTTTTPTVTTTTVDLGFDVYNTISMNSPITVVSGLGTTSAKTLGEFAIGTIDGFTAHSVINVVTWYDQSGNGRNVTNATSTQQPTLVRLDAGVATLETSAGKASVRFASANSQRLNLTNTSITYNNISNFVLANPISATANDFFFGLNDTTTTRYYIGGRSISYVTAGTFTYSAAAGVNRLYETISGTSTTSAYLNGTILSPATVTSSTVSNAFIKIGAASTGFTDGYISEAISFIGTPSRTGIESNINTYYTVW